MRRVVTGHKDGKSVFISDGMPPHVVTLENLSGLEITHVWMTDAIPAIPIEKGDPTVGMVPFIPGPGETHFRFARIPPLQGPTEGVEGVDSATVEQELQEKTPGLAEAMDPENIGVHTTDTVDYVIIMSGELWLELDDGVEVHLKQGDCVVQNGTRHAWKNRSSEACVMAVVMVGAKRS